jgi:hypothetical protein
MWLWRRRKDRQGASRNLRLRGLRAPGSPCAGGTLPGSQVCPVRRRHDQERLINFSN